MKRSRTLVCARPAPLNRPLVWIASGFASGLFVAAYGWGGGWIGPALLIPAIGVGGVFLSDRVLVRFLTVLAAAFAAGIFVWHIGAGSSAGDALSDYIANHPECRRITVTGRVRLSGIEQERESSRFFLDVRHVRAGEEPLSVSGVVVVTWDKAAFPVFAGDLLEVTGTPRISLSTVNPGIKSYEDHLRGQGVHSAVFARGGSSVKRIRDGDLWSGRRLASQFRQAQADRLAQVVPEQALPFVRAIWLGYRSRMDGEQYQRFVESGTAHILSVSGIHMAMIYVTANYLLRLIVGSRRVRTVLVMIFVLIFAAMSGVRPSALRAALMILVYLTAELFEREPDALSAMSLSSVLLLAWRPAVLFDAGFQLSFLSIASILVIAPVVEEWLRGVPRRLRGGISVSVSAQVLPTPLALSLFHVLPVGAVGANLVMVPVATAALWLTFLTTALSFICVPIATLFGHALAATVAAINAIAQVSSLPFLHVLLPNPTAPALMFYYGCAAIVVSGQFAQRRWKWSAAACGGLAVALWNPIGPPPMAVFLDVRHGDAAFIRTAAGHTMLVDGGDAKPDFDSGKAIVGPFLWAHHVRRIDRVAVSHSDRDHLGGLIYILNHFDVGELLIGAPLSSRPLEQALLKVCAERKIPIREVHAGDAAGMGDLEVRVLHPPAERPATWSVNEQSLVLHVMWEGHAIIFSGDIEGAAELSLARTAPHVDILKAPHHGSKTSSSAAFIDAVRPAHCVISTGGASGRERVADSVLSLYRTRGIDIWRTDYLGAITVGPDGRLLGERMRRGYPRVGN